MSLPLKGGGRRGHMSLTSKPPIGLPWQSVNYSAHLMRQLMLLEIVALITLIFYIRELRK